jgi:hypothetical protein
MTIEACHESPNKEFYAHSGAHFQQEQHGNGSIHWAANLDEIVLEIYPATKESKTDTLGLDSTLLMSKTSSLNCEVSSVSEPKTTR